MKVYEFMEKHRIGESRVRIFDAELGKEICGILKRDSITTVKCPGYIRRAGTRFLEVASVNG